MEEVVDYLLDSSHFGERWGRHWLDVARYAESNGRGRNMAWHHAWRYRDWGIDAFNNDLPYDQFIRQQIAGDLLPVADDEQRDRQMIATAFLAFGPKSLEERNRELFRMDTIDEQIDGICRVADPKRKRAMPGADKASLGIEIAAMEAEIKE